MLRNKSKTLIVGRWDGTLQELIVAYEERVLDPMNRMKIATLKEMLCECIKRVLRTANYSRVDLCLEHPCIEGLHLRGIDASHEAAIRARIVTTTTFDKTESGWPIIEMYRFSYFNLLRTWFAFHIILYFTIKEYYVNE